MAIFRKVHLEFWNDDEILEYTPEDKYFFLFLMTNPKTKQCGIYKISMKQMEYYTGYNKDTLNNLVERFENKYKKIRYNKETKEMAIKNWAKYNYSESPKIKACIEKELLDVKDALLIEYVYSMDTVCIEYPNKNKNKNKNKKEGLYGELNNVRLTEDEYERLIKDYGETIITKYINSLSLYQHMDKYKDHNKALRSWLNKDDIKKLSQTPKRKWIIPEKQDKL